MKPKNKYQTSIGKVEFYSLRAEKAGLSPLPRKMVEINRGFHQINIGAVEKQKLVDAFNKWCKENGIKP